MIKTELTPDECKNVRVALLSLAKSQQVNEEGMKMLLNLSDKFVVKEEVNQKADKLPEKK